jgi:hypothetical protein
MFQWPNCLDYEQIFNSGKVDLLLHENYFMFQNNAA